MKVLINLIICLLPFVLSAQNVAINNDGSVPHPSALLDISSNAKGVLFPRVTTLERTSISGPAIGLTVFDIDTYSYWVYRGDVNGGWREILIDLDKRWQLSGSHIYNLNGGNVGIGINNPQEKLSINAANPTVQFLHSNVAKSFLNVTGNDFKLGTYNNNLTGKMFFSTRGIDRMVMDQNGLIGIGTATPSTALTINGTDPSIQIRSGDSDKGYLKTTSEDVILGTNSTNLSGNLSFQTKDLERMVIEPNGDIGIGVNNPNAKLDISTANNGQVLKLNAANQTFMGIWENDGYRGYIGSFYGNLADIDVGSIAGAVHLVTGSTIDLTAKSGKVGIGTQNPTELLEVHSPSGNAFARVSTGGSGQYVGLEMVKSTGSSWRIGHGNSGRLQFIRAFDPNFTNPEVVVEAYNDSFYPGTDGTIELGTGFSRWDKVYAVNGTINTSDARDKTNIQNIHYGLDEVMKLRPVSFNWKSDPNGGTKLGLIAQELKEVVKEVVVLGDNGKSADNKEHNETSSDRYGVFYSDLIPVLIKATQEQQKIIEDLQITVEQLKIQIENR